MGRSTKIAMLLDHPGMGDGRVFNAARTLMAAGHDVRIFALLRSTGEAVAAPTNLPVDLRFEHILLTDPDIVPRAAIAAGLALPLHWAHSDETLSRLSRVQMSLGALFWHRAMARAFLPGLTRYAPDFVHAHDLATLGTAWHFQRRQNVPFLYDSHEFEAGRNGVTPGLPETIRQAQERRFISDAAGVVAVGEALADVMARLHGIVRPTVIPNISPAQAQTAGTKPAPDETKRALYLGSLQAGRGLDVFIQSIAHLPDWQGHIAGVGTAEQRRIVQAQIEAFAPGRVELDPTPLTPARAAQALAQTDVSVIPIQPSCTSYRYCLPNKLFQSLAAGRALASTPLPEIAAVLNRVGGSVASDWTASALAKAIAAAGPTAPLGAAYDFETVQNRYVALVEAALSDAPLSPKQTPATETLPHWQTPPATFAQDVARIVADIDANPHAGLARRLIRWAALFRLA